MKDAGKLKAAGYIRVSTQSQVTEGESLSTQRKPIEAYAESRGSKDKRILGGFESETGGQFLRPTRLMALFTLTG